MERSIQQQADCHLIIRYTEYQCNINPIQKDDDPMRRYTIPELNSLFEIGDIVKVVFTDGYQCKGKYLGGYLDGFNDAFVYFNPIEGRHFDTFHPSEISSIEKVDI